MKHKVIVFMFNQQKFVKQLYDNMVILQSEYDEICIVDDCSTDKTIEALHDTNIFKFENVKLVRNSQNLGINKNFSFHTLNCKADIITIMGGDDQFCPGFAKKVSEIVRTRNWDKTDKFVFVSNIIYSGKYKKLIRNYGSPARVNREYLYEVIKGTLHPVENPTSRALSDFVGDWDERFGLQADVARQLKKLYHADFVEFLDDTSLVYTANVGITSKTDGQINLSDFIYVCESILSLVSAVERRKTEPLIAYLKLLHHFTQDKMEMTASSRFAVLKLILSRIMLSRIKFRNYLFSWKLCLVISLKALFL